MIESISISPLGKPGSPNAPGTVDNTPEGIDAGEPRRVNGVEVTQAKESNRGEGSSQRHDDPSSQQGNAKVSLSLDSVVTAQSGKSNSTQPSKSPYEAAKQAEAKQPSYANTDIDA